MIEFKGVSKQYLYGNRLLGTLDLTINDGEVIAVLGEAQSGKTTFLKVLTGVTPCEGQVLYDNEDVTLKTDDVIFMFDDLALFKLKTVYGNLSYPLKLRKADKAEIDFKVKTAAEKAGIAPCLYNRVFKLSELEKKRVGLARLLIRNAKLLVLDDPTSNLNSAEEKELFYDLVEIISEKSKEGVTVVFSTSNANHALALADKIVVMHFGEVKQAGSYKEIYNFPANAWAAEAVDEYYNLIKGTLSIKNGVLTLCLIHDDKKIELDASCFNGRIMQSYINKEVLVGCHAEDFALYDFDKGGLCAVSKTDETNIAENTECFFADVKYCLGENDGYLNCTANGIKIFAQKKYANISFLPLVEKCTLFDSKGENSIFVDR